jgi:hypothetical protein
MTIYKIVIIIIKNPINCLLINNLQYLRKIKKILISCLIIKYLKIVLLFVIKKSEKKNRKY